MKKLLKAANEKNFSEFESIVLEALGEKSTALVEAIRPAVAKKVIAESNTVLKHNGTEPYVFANGDEADVTTEMVNEFVEANKGKDNFLSLVEAASASKKNFGLALEGKLEIETKIDEAKALKESILAELRPTVYSPRLAKILGWKVNESYDEYSEYRLVPSSDDFYHLQDYLHGDHSNTRGQNVFADRVKKHLGVDAHSKVMAHQAKGDHEGAIAVASDPMHKHPDGKPNLGENLQPIGNFFTDVMKDKRGPNYGKSAFHVKTGKTATVVGETAQNIMLKHADGSHSIHPRREVDVDYHDKGDFNGAELPKI
jgi:hypothetical protein